LSSNSSLNLSTLNGNLPSSVTYTKETDSFYLKAGVDVYLFSFKNLNQQLGYYVDNEYDFNANGVDDKGIYVENQTFPLEVLTGNNKDSLRIPLQGYVYNTNPRRIFQFPSTAKSKWESKNRRVVDFDLTVTAFGLNKTPAQHVYYTTRKDSIVGWGKVRVYTPNGPSIAYEVLIDKVEQYSNDSFYLNGAAAPAPLLTAFGIFQGQRTNSIYQYNFNRKGSFSYLVRYHYGSDSTYSIAPVVYVNTDNLTTTSTYDVKGESYSTVIYPNPSNGQEINLSFIGKNLQEVSYVITDMLGRIVSTSSKTGMLNNILKLETQSLNAGMYSIQVKDAENNIVASEQFNIER
jgi:Secretion system C-terminal sorting domain